MRMLLMVLFSLHLLPAIQKKCLNFFPQIEQFENAA
jgi:hypothetical protein